MSVWRLCTGLIWRETRRRKSARFEVCCPVGQGENTPTVCRSVSATLPLQAVGFWLPTCAARVELWLRRRGFAGLRNIEIRFAAPLEGAAAANFSSLDSAQ